MVITLEKPNSYSILFIFLTNFKCINGAIKPLMFLFFILNYKTDDTIHLGKVLCFSMIYFQNFLYKQKINGITGKVEYPNLLESPQPAIDRTSKPHFGAQGSFLTDNTNMMQVATSDSVSESHPRVISYSSDRTKGTVRPGVNRGTKPTALQTYEERSRGISERLHADREKKAQEESQLKAEKEREILRISKEKEAEEERVQLLQAREQELLLNITNLEEKQKAQVNSSSCLCN
jgi:hypothetical protein